MSAYMFVYYLSKTGFVHLGKASSEDRVHSDDKNASKV